MEKTIKIALVQCKILENHTEMNSNISTLIKESKTQGADLVVLPERWRSVPSPGGFSKNIHEERGVDYEFIKNLAKINDICIISGGIWEQRTNPKESNSKPFITSYYFDNSGNELGRQDKLHLYSYESEIFQAGSTLNIFLHERTGVKFAILICFDIAFFETPRVSVENGAELLISPTLIRKEGLDNWMTYLKARALENRVPVVACNPVAEVNGRFYSGKSKMITFKSGYESPSSLIISEMDCNQGIICGEVEVLFPNSIRKKRLSEKINMKKITVKKHF